MTRWCPELVEAGFDKLSLRKSYIQFVLNGDVTNVPQPPGLLQLGAKHALPPVETPVCHAKFVETHCQIGDRADLPTGLQPVLRVSRGGQPSAAPLCTQLECTPATPIDSHCCHASPL